MSRIITLPARELRQEIRSLEEYPPTVDGGYGVVTAVVGALNEDGSWSDEVPLRAVQIDGANYNELCSDTPPAWAPNKPPGTYRNEDLWHFIDLLGG